MEHMEIAKVTSKGQVTIPAAIRNILKLESGSTVIFKITKSGVVITPCQIIEKPTYSQEEWRKIERLVAEKGKKYHSPDDAKKHLDSL